MLMIFNRRSSKKTVRHKVCDKRTSATSLSECEREREKQNNNLRYRYWKAYMQVSLSFSLLPNRCSYAVYAKFIIQIAIVRSCFCVFFFIKFQLITSIKRVAVQISAGNVLTPGSFYRQQDTLTISSDFHFIQISNSWCFNSFANGSVFNIKSCIKFYYGI